MAIVGRKLEQILGQPTVQTKLLLIDMEIAEELIFLEMVEDVDLVLVILLTK